MTPAFGWMATATQRRQTEKSHTLFFTQKLDIDGKYLEVNDVSRFRQSQ